MNFIETGYKKVLKRTGNTELHIPPINKSQLKLCGRYVLIINSKTMFFQNVVEYVIM